MASGRVGRGQLLVSTRLSTGVDKPKRVVKKEQLKGPAFAYMVKPIPGCGKLSFLHRVQSLTLGIKKDDHPSTPPLFLLSRPFSTL